MIQRTYADVDGTPSFKYGLGSVLRRKYVFPSVRCMRFEFQ